MQSIKAYREKNISNETKLDGCRIHFRGAALRTQQMLLSMGMLKAPLQLPSQTTPLTKAN